MSIGTTKYTTVISTDKKDYGANHEYEIVDSNEHYLVYSSIRFQKGPIKEKGVNGCHHEDLIIILLDRLLGFQETEFACEENKQAIIKLEEVLFLLNKRTADRAQRNVEGTSQI